MLWLLSNQLTGEIPRELASLPQLQTLNLGGNHLTGTIPAELAVESTLPSAAE